MKKKSPKQQRPKPPADATLEVQTPAPAKKQPVTIKNQDDLPPDAAARRDKFYKDAADIEQSILRSIYD